jgi:hypothetical protein
LQFFFEPQTFPPRDAKVWNWLRGSSGINAFLLCFNFFQFFVLINGFGRHFQRSLCPAGFVKNHQDGHQDIPTPPTRRGDGKL